MSDTEQPVVGAVGWFDLTVPEAEKIRDFYSAGVVIALFAYKK